ncbi:hypothetical protein [Listeria monocytogenes]|uniref:hypothetical protein n=1 Tax=Listeria monocytogenes TaxID=1639 RepID=UPI001E5BA182|nr:hypothetical protein [Listeria monocytogenes]MCD2221763.1 hypothetical protein [Listeria monocytogenes]
MNNKRILWWILFVAIIILVPSLIGIGMNCFNPNFIAGTNEAWLGFWGGYLGAIVSIIGALFLFREQVKKDKKEIDITLKEQTKLTATFAYYEFLLTENKLLQNIIQEITTDIFQYNKLAIELLDIPVGFASEQKSKINQVNSKLTTNFNKIKAITAVVHGRRLNGLHCLLLTRYQGWHKKLTEGDIPTEKEINAEYKRIIRISNNMRTKLVNESLDIVTKMKDKMD